MLKFYKFSKNININTIYILQIIQNFKIFGDAQIIGFVFYEVNSSKNKNSIDSVMQSN